MYIAEQCFQKQMKLAKVIQIFKRETLMLLTVTF